MMTRIKRSMSKRNHSEGRKETDLQRAVREHDRDMARLDRNSPPPAPKTFSWHQDLALDACRSSFPPCPFSCAKDGSANCDYHVRNCECEPGRQTLGAAKLVQIVAIANDDGVFVLDSVAKDLLMGNVEDADS